VAFRHGEKIGLRYDHSTGVIHVVAPGSQGDLGGVKTGWRMVKVDGVEYSHEGLLARTTGSNGFNVVFDTKAEAPSGYVGVYTESVRPQNLAFMIDVSSMQLIGGRTAAMTLNPREIARLLIGNTQWGSVCSVLPTTKRIEIKQIGTGKLELTAENKPLWAKTILVEKGVDTETDIMSTVIKEPIRLATGASLIMFMKWTSQPQSETVEIKTFEQLKTILEQDPKDFMEKVLFASLKNEFSDVDLGF